MNEKLILISSNQWIKLIANDTNMQREPPPTTDTRY